eukprot:4428433-Pleurochrysis_carterae.AAC.7
MSASSRDACTQSAHTCIWSSAFVAICTLCRRQPVRMDSEMNGLAQMNFSCSTSRVQSEIKHTKWHGEMAQIDVAKRHK